MGKVNQLVRFQAPEVRKQAIPSRLSSPNNLLPFLSRIAYSHPMLSITNARGYVA